jgi:hypothetical protein
MYSVIKITTYVLPQLHSAIDVVKECRGVALIYYTMRR